MKRVLMIMILCLVVAGCGSSSSSGTPAGTTASLNDLVAAWCARIGECGTVDPDCTTNIKTDDQIGGDMLETYGTVNDPGETVNINDLIAGVTAGTYEYTEAAIDACIAYFEALPCTGESSVENGYDDTDLTDYSNAENMIEGDCEAWITVN